MVLPLLDLEVLAGVVSVHTDALIGGMQVTVLVSVVANSGLIVVVLDREPDRGLALDSFFTLFEDSADVRCVHNVPGARVAATPYPVDNGHSTNCK